MTAPLDGLRVRISISDPWDFYTENGPLVTGKVVSLGRSSVDDYAELRIHLDTPLKEKRLVANEVFARFRHANKTVEHLSSGESVSCNFSNLPEDDWKLAAPDARMGFIGGLQLQPR